MFNYGVPDLAITKINGDLMTIKHVADDFGTLDLKYAERTMELVNRLWKGAVELETIDDEGKVLFLSYDQEGFSTVTP